jgi:membrane fusion protein (multidrug efflux system)
VTGIGLESPRGAAGLFLTALAILFSAGCGRSVARAPVAAVEVHTAERRDIPETVELPARTEASAVVEVHANVDGRLTEVLFQEGRLLPKGRLLYRIEPSRYAAAVQSAEAAVARAEADVELATAQQRLVNAQSALRQAEANLLKCNQDLERLKPLAARRAVPARDLDAAVAAQASAAAAVEDARATARTTSVSDRIGLKQAQAGLAAANAALQTARLDLAETEIHAPIAGLIGRAEISAGNYVTRGDPRRLSAISRVDPVHVVFGIGETLYLRTVNTVEETALAHIGLVLADNTVYPIEGRFSNLTGGVDDKTGALLAVARFPNPKAVLLPGMTGRVRFTAGVRKGAVLIPERALLDAQGSKAVYLLDSGKAALRRVTVGGAYQGRIVVTAGLAGGEQVIVAGGEPLRPGQLVVDRASP